MTLREKYMIGKTTRFLMILLMCLTALSGCKDPWDDRGGAPSTGSTLNLMEKIKAEASLSVFSSYLVQTGYDKVITSSKNFTVWAPTNTALQGLDVAIVGDTAKLKAFVGNHISNSAYATSFPADTAQRILMLNGKYVSFSKTTFDDAKISTANQYALNGVLHMVDAAVPVRLSIWEYLNNAALGLNQKNYLLSLNRTYQDTALATVTGYDAVTGKPILKPGTGIVTANRFLSTVHDVSKESGQYTFFLLTDDAYNTEQNKLSPYYYSTNTITDSTTAFLSSWNVVKDLAVRGSYSVDKLPAQLLSTNNVNIPINKSAIVASYKASNGWVYVMNSMNFAVTEKIPTITIQGESPYGFSSSGYSGYTFFPSRVDNLGTVYNYIEVYRSLISSFTVYYRLRNIPSATYHVLWRAVAGVTGDPQTVTFNQKLTFTSSSLTTDLGYKAVPVASATDPVANAAAYADLPIGDIVVTKYGNVYMSLISAASTSQNVNSLSLDYVKLVPVIR